MPPELIASNGTLLDRASKALGVRATAATPMTRMPPIVNALIPLLFFLSVELFQRLGLSDVLSFFAALGVGIAIGFVIDRSQRLLIETERGIELHRTRPLTYTRPSKLDRRIDPHSLVVEDTPKYLLAYRTMVGGKKYHVLGRFIGPYRSFVNRIAGV